MTESKNLRSTVKSIEKRIRVKKEDSAYVYFILESYEGITSYSTLDFRPGDPYRDLELKFPAESLDAVTDLLQELEKELGDRIHVNLPSNDAT